MEKIFSIKKILFLIIMGIVLFSCKEQPKNLKKAIPNQDTIDQRMMNVNIILENNEIEKIEDYIKRYQWEMKTTASGLKYMVYKQGNGKHPQKNSKIKIKYRCSLLNGVTIYNSDIDGLKVFFVGKAEVETGLEEGILLLKVGDKAKFIIPSRLAFGLIGDQKKIPKKATLVYDVELLEVI
ncbi:MAG: FKBP-type peptidyl-prolyl cis-trans isomerase [Bacteroidota bacterium]